MTNDGKGRHMTSRHSLDGRRHGQRRLAHDLTWGGALIVIGAFWWSQGNGWFASQGAWLLAPALIAWSGLVSIVVERSGWDVASGVTRIAVAAYLYIVVAHVGGLDFDDTWPLALIALGAVTLARGLFDRKDEDGAHDDGASHVQGGTR
jgi:hypothetical protein